MAFGDFVLSFTYPCIHLDPAWTNCPLKFAMCSRIFSAEFLISFSLRWYGVKEVFISLASFDFLNGIGVNQKSKTMDTFQFINDVTN